MSATGWGDILVMKKEGKIKLYSKYFPWTIYSDKINFVYFSGVISVFAILAYVFTILAGVSQEITMKILSYFCATSSGIVFYAGFLAPKWPKRIWEK